MRRYLSASSIISRSRLVMLSPVRRDLAFDIYVLHVKNSPARLPHTLHLATGRSDGCPSPRARTQLTLVRLPCVPFFDSMLLPRSQTSRNVHQNRTRTRTRVYNQCSARGRAIHPPRTRSFNLRHPTRADARGSMLLSINAPTRFPLTSAPTRPTLCESPPAPPKGNFTPRSKEFSDVILSHHKVL